MTDEEKEAIEQLRSWREYIIKHKEDVNKANDIEFYLRTAINLIEKQSKEIEELIVNQCIYQDTSSCTRSISLKMYTELNNYIRKDKIKPIQIIDLDGKIHNVYKIEED